MDCSENNVTIETGVKMEEHSFTWKIDHVPILLRHDSMIKSQRIEVTAGAAIGQHSTWEVYLEIKKESERCPSKRVNISYKVKRPPVAIPGKSLYSQLKIARMTEAGHTFWSKEMTVQEVSKENRGFRLLRLDKHHPVIITDERWVFHLTLKLYSCTSSPPPPTVESTLEEFQLKFAAKAREDLGRLLENPIADDGMVNIILKNKKEFAVNKGILSARSPVFEAMFRVNMSEANQGRVQLSDITARPLKIILHFIYTGELLREWRHAGVIVQLVNAAAKYQISDLLEFFDLTLGEVCTLKNVGALLTLADQLSLKRAEKQLLNFIRENGVTSKQSVFRIMNSSSSVSSLMDES